MESSENEHNPHAHLSRVGPAGGVIILLLLALFLAAGWVTESSRKIDRRHDDFVAARPPWYGRSWDKKDAVLYRDVEHPLTWHVCTADGCGIYFEAGEEKK